MRVKPPLKISTQINVYEYISGTLFVKYETSLKGGRRRAGDKYFIAKRESTGDENKYQIELIALGILQAAVSL